MSKISVAIINNNKYKYAYNPDNGKTEYLGPVGNSPAISETEFLKLVDPKTGKRKRDSNVDPKECQQDRVKLYREKGISLEPGNLDFDQWIQMWRMGALDDTYEKEAAWRVCQEKDRIKEKYNTDLQRLDDSKDFVSGTVTALITEMDFRIGNPKSAEDDDHVGATTLRKENVKYKKGQIIFDYVGKSGVEHHRVTDNPEIVQAIRHLKHGKKPREFLFKYKGRGDRFYQISDEDIRDYLLEFDTTPKDIRTYNANQYFVEGWNEGETVKQSVERVSNRLQNTPSVAKRNYIDDLLYADLREIEKNRD
jgi:hypothetical protein